MKDTNITTYLQSVINNLPTDWLNLTTHRLDIYKEELAKTEFLEEFEALYAAEKVDNTTLASLPTAFDYIRLGHPLSCVLEWGIAKINGLNPDNVISFSSKTAPILAILRKNLMDRKNTRIVYTGNLPSNFDAEVIRSVYGYHFDMVSSTDLTEDIYDGTTVFVSNETEIGNFNFTPKSLPNGIDFYVALYENLGSILVVSKGANENYIGAIQHVRRRETIAMTPSNTLIALQLLVDPSSENPSPKKHDENHQKVVQTIKEITGVNTTALIGSSGLSIQYAIVMGLIHHAEENHKGKAIKIVVPPNCYGGTNDQARRVAACLPNVEVMDLPVDGGNNMVRSVDIVLETIAAQDAIPYIIAEIPTNPRVEVPNLIELREVLSMTRKTKNGDVAVAPVFILDQTFCPNVHFLGENDILSSVSTISYVSGSKFPSGGKCTAGYCVANQKAIGLMNKIDLHLRLCDNQATPLQMELLAQQLPSMNKRIYEAYKNTREFVDFIKENLPGAKINFVSEELAAQGFTPSVFSLDLPTKGNTDEEREAYKRALNLDLINRMITEIPDESKYCVSYGQLKGCYWTIPATSTQGTTKEGDKDYIARVALSANMNLERHKEVFLDFVKAIG